MPPKPRQRKTVPLKPATAPQAKSLAERLLASGAKPGTDHGAHILPIRPIRKHSQ